MTPIAPASACGSGASIRCTLSRRRSSHPIGATPAGSPTQPSSRQVPMPTPKWTPFGSAAHCPATWRFALASPPYGSEAVPRRIAGAKRFSQSCANGAHRPPYQAPAKRPRARGRLVTRANKSAVARMEPVDPAAMTGWVGGFACPCLTPQAQQCVAPRRRIHHAQIIQYLRPKFGDDFQKIECLLPIFSQLIGCQIRQFGPIQIFILRLIEEPLEVKSQG